MNNELLTLIIFISYSLIGIITAAISKINFPNYSSWEYSDPPPIISGIFWPLFYIFYCTISLYNYIVKLLEKNKFE